MDNSGYDISGISLFSINPIDTAINENKNTVKVYGNQTIGGDKVFTGTVTLENEVIHNSTSFSTEDGIIEQLKGNTGDMLDYGNYGVYNDGTSTKYKGIINKKQTDKFYVFHNQINQPVSSLNLGTQDLGTLVVRDPVENNEAATKQYVESHGGGSYLPLSGGTLTGDLIMSNKDIIKIRNLYFDDTGLYNVLRFPTSNRLSVIDGDGTPFMHFNSLASNQLIELSKDTNVNGDITMLNSKRILGLLNPISNDEPANKSYADTKLSLNGGIINGDFGFTTQLRKLLLAGKTSTNSTPEGNFITTISNNDLVIYKGLKFLAMNNDETYTNQRLNMNNNNIINCDSITADKLNITTNTGIINFGDNTVDNILGGNSYTQIAGGNDKYFVCNQLNNETNNNINMLGNEIINCESITCQGSVLTLSAGGAGAFRITNTLNDSLVPIRMNTNKITNLGTPTADTDAATKKYVDDNIPVVPTSSAIYTPITLPSPNNGLFRNYNYQTSFQPFLSITTPNFPIPAPNQRIKYTIHLPILIFNGDSAEVSIRYIYYDSGVRIDPAEFPYDCGNTFKRGELGYEFALTNNTGILNLTRNAFPTNLRIDIELFVMGGSGSIAKLLTGDSGRQMLPYLETQLITV